MTDIAPSVPLWTAVVPLSVRTQERTNSIQAKFTLSLRREPHRKLDVCITQDPDSYFLYTLSLSDDDFHLLKAEQGLVVDFNVFPDKLIELLTACQNVSTSKFLAQLLVENISRPAILNIIETNTFKQIIHLGLNMVPGDDATIKKYLAGLVSHLKEEVQSLKSSKTHAASKFKDQLREYEAVTTSLREQLDSLRASHAEELRKFSLKHSEDLSKERELHLNEKDKERQQLEQKRRELESRMNDEIQSLTIKNTTMHASLEQTTQQKQLLEAQLESAKQLHGLLTADHAALQARCQTLMSEKSNTESENARLKTELQRQTELAVVLESREKGTLEQCAKVQRELERETERREALQADVEHLRGQLVQLEATARESHSEMQKGNEIIGKLQVELKTLKAKCKLKSMVTVQQEKLVEEKSQHLNETLLELEAVRNQLLAAQKSVVEKETALETATRDLEEAKKLNEERHQLIDWLHQQLNQNMSYKDPTPLDPPLLAAATTNIPSYRLASPLKSQTATRLLQSVQQTPRMVTSPTKSVLSSTPMQVSAAGTNSILGKENFKTNYISSIPVSTARKKSNFF